MRYEALPDFQNVLLEESYVLDIVARPALVEVTLDVVLLEGHEFRRAPLPDEQFSFARATIRFTDVTDLSWTDQGRGPAVDAAGEIDYGSVDSLEHVDGAWLLVGDWGSLRIVARSIALEIHDR